MHVTQLKETAGMWRHVCQLSNLFPLEEANRLSAGSSSTAPVSTKVSKPPRKPKGVVHLQCYTQPAKS